MAKKNEDQSILFAELSGPVPPREFPEFDENIETDHACAVCGYLWSGGDKSDDDLGDPDAKECPRCGETWNPPDEHEGQEDMFEPGRRMKERVRRIKEQAEGAIKCAE